MRESLLNYYILNSLNMREKIKECMNSSYSWDNVNITFHIVIINILYYLDEKLENIDNEGLIKNSKTDKKNFKEY